MPYLCSEFTQTTDSRLSHSSNTENRQRKMRQDVKQNEVAALAEKLPESTEQKFATLTDGEQQLVVRHIPLAYAAAWRMRDRNVPLDELRQEACLGLCLAAQRFDSQAGTSFATYASHWCRKMVLRALQRQPCHTQQPDGPDTAPPDDEQQLRSAQLQRLDDALQQLPPLLHRIVTQHYGIGTPRRTLAETADALGISKARASLLHRHALQRLEAELARRPLADYLASWLE